MVVVTRNPAGPQPEFNVSYGTGRSSVRITTRYLDLLYVDDGCHIARPCLYPSHVVCTCAVLCSPEHILPAVIQPQPQTHSEQRHSLN
jgi:hypothetical protein